MKPASAAPPRPSRVRFWAALGVLCAASFLVYWPSLTAPFIFDDHSAIVDNPEIKDFQVCFSKIAFPEKMEAGLTDNRIDPARPLTFATYALNFAAGGYRTWGYHLFNIAAHFGVVLLMFVLTGRLAKMASAGPAQAAALPPASRKSPRPPPPAETPWTADPALVAFAFAASLLFAVHPLNTEVVAYISHRSDSLATLFYLGAVLFFLKACETAGRQGHALSWGGWAMGACAASFVLSFLSKQIAITLPAVLLALDFVFLSGFRAAPLKGRALLHGSVWAVFVFLLIYRATSLGFLGDPGVETGVNWTPLTYFLTQLVVVPRYFGLALFPAGQCIDHAVLPTASWADAVPALLLALGSAAGAFWGVRRWIRPALNNEPGAAPVPVWLKIVLFSAFWVFVTLLPTSSFLPINDAMAERRMYLPGIGFFLLFAAAVWAGAGKSFGGKTEVSGGGLFRAARFALWVLFCVYLLALSGLTALRAHLYRDPVAMWQSVVSLYPGNARAHYNLGKLYRNSKNDRAAVEEYRKVIGIKPGYVSAYNNLGNIYKQRGDYAEALPLLLKAVELNPRHVNAHFNLGEVYEKTGVLEKAFDHYQTALKLSPSLEAAHKVGKLSQELKIVPDEEVIPYLRRVQKMMSRPIPGTPPPFPNR